MRERQVYEFVAVDRPLSEQERMELRAVSTRAEISSTRLWNEYHWGDLKADPRELLARYFDVHLYTAGWGERRLLVRLPADRVDVAAWRPYLGARCDVLVKIGAHYVLELSSDADCDGYDVDEVEVADGAALLGVRVALLGGDMRVPYLAWLLAVQGGGVADDVREPPVPPGLDMLPAPLAALVEFLRIDLDLLAAAAAGGERTAGQLRACAGAGSSRRRSEGSQVGAGW